MHNPTGERYGMLEIIGYTEKRYKNGDRYVAVRCDCGQEKEMTYPSVRRENGNRSCGCQRWQGTHKQSGTPLYRAWTAMLSRCYQENDVAYKNYGGRGISVAPEWHHFERFAFDMGESFSPGLVLDREKNDEGYSAANCRWLTRQKSNQNMRSNIVVYAAGTPYCFAELVRVFGTVSYSKARYRYRVAGYSLAKAIGCDDLQITFEEDHGHKEKINRV